MKNYLCARVICCAFLLIPPSIGNAECNFVIPGQRVMTAFKSAGSMPSIEGGSCSYDVSKNIFNAGPDESCSVHFRDSMLEEHWKFSKIKGEGSFKSTSAPGEVVITIDVQGGFKPDSFSFNYSSGSGQVDCSKIDGAIDKILK